MVEESNGCLDRYLDLVNIFKYVFFYKTLAYDTRYFINVS